MRRRVVATGGAVVLLLLAGCSDSGSPGSVPSPGEPSQTAGPAATTTVTVPTGPPAAATAALGPTGPGTAKPCQGTTIPVGKDPQPVIDAARRGTVFCFARGVHRITKPIQPRTGDTLGGGAGVVLTGSVRLTGWKRSGNAWVVRGALPSAYPLKGQCEDNQSKPCQRGEQVFVDGKHLTRVMRRGDVKPGTFFGDYTANAVYVGDDPDDRDIELSRTQTAIEKSADNVIVTGLTIEHFASRAQGGALEVGRGWKVTGNEVRWNHAVGIMVIEGDGAQLSRNTVADNGQLGIGQYKSAGVRITANLVTRNNTDGFWIADWESGGIKSTRSSGEVSGNDIVANRGIGMWSDIAEYDRRITGNRIRDNAADGIRYEISYQALIDLNVVENNGFGTGRGSGGTPVGRRRHQRQHLVGRPGPRQPGQGQPQRHLDPVPHPRRRPARHVRPVRRPDRRQPVVMAAPPPPPASSRTRAPPPKPAPSRSAATATRSPTSRPTVSPSAEGP